jgi:hypothetical protein
MAPGGLGGLVFDYYGPNDFKFVRIDAARDVVEVGHVDQKNGLSIDKVYDKTLDDASSHHLKLSFIGASVSISVDNAMLGTYGFNAALVDGEFGLVSFGTTLFDEMTIRTNDPAFDTGDNLLAASAADASVGPEGWVTESQLAAIVDASIAGWAKSSKVDAATLARLDDVSFVITDLPDEEQLLGRVDGNTVYIDLNAAGHGWFIDTTPEDNAEFSISPEENVLLAADSLAGGRIDLLTVVSHEIGHLLGLDHSADDGEAGLMDLALETGVRLLPEAETDTGADEIGIDIATLEGTEVAYLAISTQQLLLSLPDQALEAATLPTSEIAWDHQPEQGVWGRLGGMVSHAFENARVMLFDDKEESFIDYEDATSDSQADAGAMSAEGQLPEDWTIMDDSDSEEGSDVPMPPKRIIGWDSKQTGGIPGEKKAL